MRTASGIAMTVVVIVMLAAAGGALRFYVDHQAMQTMIDDYGAALAALPLTPGPAAQAFAGARDSARTGDYDAAKSKLREGARALAQSPPGGEPAGGSTPAIPPAVIQAALDRLPEKARPFFKEHPDLLRQAVGLYMAGQSAQAPGAKEKLDKIVEQVVEAAAAGDAKAVRKALGEGRQALGLPRRGGRGLEGGGMPLGGPPAELAGAIEQARQLLTGARQAGADVSRPSGLLDQAEALLKAGQPEAAAQKTRQAFDLMRQMAQRAGGRRPGMARGGQRRPMRGGPPGFLPGMFGALLGQMEAESPVIAAVMEDLRNAGAAIVDQGPDQARQILNQATQKLTRIRASRDELSAQMQEVRRGGRPPGPGGQRPRPGMLGGPPLDPKRTHDLVGRAFDEARGIPPEQYEQQREEFIRRLLTQLFRPDGPEVEVPGGPLAPPTGLSLPPIETPEAEPTDPEARARLDTAVRDRLRLLQEPYAKLAEADVDLAEITRLVQEARTAVNEGRLLDAAQATNHAGDLIFQLLEINREKLAPPGPPSVPAGG